MWLSLFLLTVLCTGLSTQLNLFNDTCVQGRYPPPQKNKVHEYTIDLDLPAEHRWDEVAKAKKREIQNILKSFEKYADEFGDVAAEVIYFIKLLGPALVDGLPQPFRDELKGISNITGIEIGEITLYNIFYEIFSVCTSIIATDPSGKVYHARNLDFGLFMGWDVKNNTWQMTEVLRPAIVNLKWVRGGQTVFRSVNYAGYVGILTGIAPGRFTLTMNERFNIDGGYRGIFEYLMTGKGEWMGFLTRRTMETALSYDQALHMLTEKQMIAPAYFILAGNTIKQACVITRSREVNRTDIWRIGDNGTESWYILETNYDHWSTPLFVDDRRTPANKCMRKLTQKNVGISGLYNVLSSKPVLNKLTTYTALMQVNTGHLETWLQYCPDPCDPW